MRDRTPTPNLCWRALSRRAVIMSLLVFLATTPLLSFVALAESAGLNEDLRRSLTPSRREPVLPDEPDWLSDDGGLDSEFDEATDPDPWEGFNRVMFSFNQGVDRFVLNPFTHIYQALIPRFARAGIHNVFVNLDAPVRGVNALLQGRPKAATVVGTRFVINSTFGFGGLFEAGDRVGLPKQQADFGQTLASWGAGRGPYVVVPVLGPMTVRNGLGMGVDIAFQPLSYIAGPLPGAMVGVGRDFSRREQSFIELQALEGASMDFYAAFRSAFLQDRAELDALGIPEDASFSLTSTGSDHLDISTLGGPIETRNQACTTGHRAIRSAFKPTERRRHAERCAVGGSRP